VGTVYGAVPRGPAGLRKRAAIKVPRPDAVARVVAALDGFLAEARLGASLEHPNIVDVYELGEIDGRTFVAMEWVRGPTLADLLRDRALPPPTAASCRAPRPGWRARPRSWRPASRG
jgi:serine/threonine protein kinase